MTDRRISVTLKAGTGYEAPWVVLGGDTLEEVNHQLDTILGAQTLQKAAAVAAAFHNGYRSIKHNQDQGQQPSAPPQGPPPAQGAHQGYSQPQGQQDPWAGQGAPQGDPWAQQQAPQAQQGWGGQQQPQGQSQGQQQPQWQPGQAPPGCQCGQQMEYKMAGAAKDKPVWRCKDWRWNNGNPTPNHDQIWIEGNH